MMIANLGGSASRQSHEHRVSGRWPAAQRGRYLAGTSRAWVSQDLISPARVRQRPTHQRQGG